MELLQEAPATARGQCPASRIPYNLASTSPARGVTWLQVFTLLLWCYCFSQFVFLSCTLFTKAPPPFCLSVAESVVLDGDLEVQLEVRPVSDSGLLLLAGKSPEQHLRVVLSHGEVRKHWSSGKRRRSPATEQCVRCLCAPLGDRLTQQ